MPLPVLRAWADDLATRTSSRRAARRLRMSVEGLRQFIRADTRPQERTRRKVGEAYLAERVPGADGGRPRRVAETRASYGPGCLEDDLRAALPVEREAALRRVAEIFAPARAVLDARALEAALLRWIRERFPPPGDGKPAGGQK